MGEILDVTNSERISCYLVYDPCGIG